MRVPSNMGILPYISKSRPIRVEFVKREQQKSTKKLVEVIEPTDEVPSKTENIAEFNSVSSGPVKKEGDLPGPPLIESEKVETLGSENPRMQIANVIPPPKKQRKIKSEEEHIKKEKPSLNDLPKIEKDNVVIQKQENEMKKEVISEKDSVEKVSKPEYLGNTFQKPQGKIYNQIKKEGILGFEALQDQLAPYLKEIQRKVEKYWLHYLLTRYSGTKPTEVIIDCEINSEGKVVRIDVIGKPEDPLFVGICKQALQVSSPFSPFPFQVPDIYQNKNLQIRWTFSFM